MAKGTRKTEEAKITRPQFESAVEVYSSNNKSLDSISSKMEEEIAKIRANYAEQIKNLELVQDSQFTLIKNFVLANSQTLFSPNKRSVTIKDVVLGLRKDTPSVKTTGGKTWEEVIKMLKEKNTGLIRTVEVVDKELILSKRDTLTEVLAECNLKIAQEDKFFISPIQKKDE